jgi:hypothetical protein
MKKRMAAELSKGDSVDEAVVVRLLPWFWVAVALAIVVGCAISIATSDSHWIERFGKLVVAISLVLTLVQFKFEAKIEQLINAAESQAKASARDKGYSLSESKNLAERHAVSVKARLHQVRIRVFIQAIASGIIGELIAGFGGVLFSGLARLW